MKRVPTAPRQPKNIAAYLRVSTDEQAESGLGIEAQRGQARAMATVTLFTTLRCRNCGNMGNDPWKPGCYCLCRAGKLLMERAKGLGGY